MKLLLPVLLASALVAAACGGSSPVSASRSAQRVTGRVVSNPSGQPIAGATVELLGASGGPLTTDAAGTFALEGPGGNLRVRITAPGHLPRETGLRAGEARENVAIDVIADQPPFSLDFYRELVRNARDNTATFGEVQRWLRDPAIYIRTVTEDSGAMVPPHVIQMVQATISESVPFWTGGGHRVQSVETGTAAAQVKTGVVGIQFYAGAVPVTEAHLCAGGRFYFDPATSPAGPYAIISLSLGCQASQGDGTSVPTPTPGIVRHEIGHAMGFNHHSLRGALGMQDKLGEILEIERFHAAIAYARPQGNRDVDVDPPEFHLLTAASAR